MMKKMLALALGFMVSLSIMTTATAGTAADRKTVLNLTNADRNAHDVGNLKLDKSLSRKALKHSKWMATNGLIHSKSLAPYLRGKSWSIAGENIGSGPDLSIMQKAFMDSPTHRRNILNKKFKKIGVGVFHDGEKYWVTVLFYG